MDAPSFEGLSPIIASGVATFFVGLAAVNKWFDLQKNETTQVAIIQADRDDWKEKAEAFEIKAEQAWSTVNQLNRDLTELKVSNGIMTEQLSQLRQRNAELSQQLQEFMRLQNARANT
jgi:septal ring factor EnvC (AmiA/AmiB activator)